MLTENVGKDVEQTKVEDIHKVSRKKEKPVENTVNNVPTDVIVDGELDFSEMRKKRFRINGDNSKILELNVSDMNTMVRLKEDYPKLITLANKVTRMKDGEKDDIEAELDRMADILKEIDNEMRGLVDHIFNANVSEICASDGSMYDLFNGIFRFEHIIEKVGALYGANLSSEIKAVKARVQKYTRKYTGK